MCGIAGFIAGNRPDSNEILHRMVDCIRYRGPDESGYYLDDQIGLGHARLSIIDPRNGKQPAVNEAESVVVIFNGEIFNFLALRKELAARGHLFNNNSDTAILPHLYEEYGLSMFEKLNGQFAIAVWDKPNKRLILARDRFGEKPVYYYHNDQTFCFASEAKAIFQSGFVRAAVSPAALKHVFTYWTTVGDESIFRDIYQVPPGCYLIFENSKAETKAYWRYTYSRNKDLEAAGQFDYAEALESRLTASIKDRMVSDVPVSFYLSGGLDSSLITCMAGKITGQRLNTFSITFDDEHFDESEYQDVLSKHLGSNHRSVAFSKNQIPSIIKDVIYHAEVPLLRSGAFPMYVLAGLVKSNDMKVVLSGEGSDELFGGYDLFREVKIREFCGRSPDSKVRPLLYKRVNQFVKGLADQTSGSLSYFYGGSGTDTRFASHLSRWKLGAFSQQFFSSEYREAMRDHVEPESLEPLLPDEFAEWSGVQRAQYLEVITLFSNYLLSSQGDRVSMGNSVECRYPFLDYDVFDYASALPDHMKIRGLNEKYIVKKLAQKYVPDKIAKRKKFPYRAPINIAELMKDEYVRDIMSGATLKKYGVFQPEAVLRFLSSVRLKASPNERDCMLFMGFLTTQVLYELFIDEA
jgi:asparagine synthase (glutamine-hydrolysing)